MNKVILKIDDNEFMGKNIGRVKDKLYKYLMTNKLHDVFYGKLNELYFLKYETGENIEHIKMRRYKLIDVFYDIVGKYKKIYSMMHYIESETLTFRDIVRYALSDTFKHYILKNFQFNEIRDELIIKEYVALIIDFIVDNNDILIDAYIKTEIKYNDIISEIMVDKKRPTFNRR